MLLGTVMHEHVSHDEVRVDDAADTHPSAGNFLDNKCVSEQGLTQAPILLRDHQPKDAKLFEPIDDIGRVLIIML